MLFSLTTNKIPGRTFPWLSRSVGTLKTYHTHTDKMAAARHWSLAVLLSIFSTDSTTSSATIEKPHHSTMHRVPKILGWSPSTDLLIFSSEVLLSCCSLCNIFEFPGFSGCRNVYHKGFKHNKLLLFFLWGGTCHVMCQCWGLLHGLAQCAKLWGAFTNDFLLVTSTVVITCIQKLKKTCCCYYYCYQVTTAHRSV